MPGTRVKSAGGWLDRDQRRLAVASPAALSAMNSLDKTDDFVELPSSFENRY